MPAVKNSADIARKWATVTPQRATEYEAGVRNPVRDWSQNAQAANDAYKTGVTQAAQQDRFKTGIARAGTGKWQRRAIELGSSRFGAGVTVAQPDYQAGFAPYRDVIERTQLPPRFAKRDPRNIERVRVMAQALAQAKQAAPPAR